MVVDRSNAGAALLIASLGALALLAGLELERLQPSLAPLAGGFAFELFLGLIALALASFAGVDRAERLGLGPGRIPGGEIALLIAGTLLLSFALDGAYALTGGDEGDRLAEFEAFLAGARGWTVAAALLSFALAPGVAEEMLCRGLIQRSLVGHVRPALAIAMAAAVFGALHVEPRYALLTALLGAYLGVITQVGDSIRPAIACHAANNAVAVVATAWGVQHDVGWGGVGTAAVGAAAALAWVCARRLGSGVALETAGLQLEPDSDDS